MRSTELNAEHPAVRPDAGVQGGKEASGGHQRLAFRKKLFFEKPNPRVELYHGARCDSVLKPRVEQFLA